MKKKPFFLLLCTVIIFTLLPVNSLASQRNDFIIRGEKGIDYTIDTNGVITLISGNMMSISGNTTTNRIVVAKGITANIILADANIDLHETGACAFDIQSGAVLNLVLYGNNTLISGGGYAGLHCPDGAALNITELDTTYYPGTLNLTGSGGGAGIGGGSYKETGTFGTITIDSGTVNVTGGFCAAGIGAGVWGSGAGTVIINGGVINATGGKYSAGIGGGMYESATVIINGGTVNAAGGCCGAGIGGNEYGSGGNVYINGGSVKATSGGDDSEAIGMGSYGANSGNLQNNSTKKVPVYPTTIQLENVSTVTAVSSLRITLNNVVYNYGIKDMFTDSDGRLYLYLPQGATVAEVDLDLQRYVGSVTGSSGTLSLYVGFNISGNTEGYTYHDSILAFTKSGDYKVSMSDGALYNTTDKIKILNGITVNLTLKDIVIDLPAKGGCAFDMSGATVNLTISGTNTFKSGNAFAGLQCPAGSTLTINGSGTLNITGGKLSAGIGSGYNTSNTNTAGTIKINSGFINAIGSDFGAGIGSGYSGDGGIITINGGTVTATGGRGGAGIGSGLDSGSGQITINGGTVTATGGEYAAGIGNGYLEIGDSVDFGIITINAGIVTAKGGIDAVGIGSGDCYNIYGKISGTITISGGVVFAQGDSYMNDIGYSTYGMFDGKLSISDTAAVFLKNNNCIQPDTTSHKRYNITGTNGGSVYGIPVPWSGSFGAYLRLFTISFDSNGGYGTVAPLTQHAVTTTALPDGSSLSHEGYIFACWNTEADGSGIDYLVGKMFPFKADMTLYAMWAPEYGLEHDNDVSGVDSQLPATYTMNKNDIAIWNPLPSDGAWDWNENYFSITSDSPVTFIALKEGTSAITYTVNGTTQSVIVTISAAGNPQTGEANTLTYVFAMLFASIIMILLTRQIKRRSYDEGTTK